MDGICYQFLKLCVFFPNFHLIPAPKHKQKTLLCIQHSEAFLLRCATVQSFRKYRRKNECTPPPPDAEVHFCFASNAAFSGVINRASKP